MLTYTQQGSGDENGNGKPATPPGASQLGHAPLGASQMIGTGEDRGEKNPFDRWIHQKLHGVFDAIAQEPLPPELLKLVRDLEAKEKQSGT